MNAAPLVLLALVPFSRPVRAQESRPYIRHVILEPKEVFDVAEPGQDVWVYRLANWIHINTRSSIVQRDLLLQPGDRWDPLLALESERILRNNPYLKNARLTAEPAGPDAVDMRVRTQDTWTLAVYAGFGTRGGENAVSYGVSEENLFGWGKTLSVIKTDEGPTSVTEGRYLDPRLFGSWVRLTALEGDHENGKESQLLVERPYYSLRTPAAFDIGDVKLDRDANLYSGSDILSTFRQHHASSQLGVGVRVKDDPLFPHRLDLRYRYENDSFAPQAATLPGTLPRDRTLSGFVLGYSWIQSHYIEGTFINRAERVEDFNLGNEGRLAAGPFPKSLGSDRDRWLFEASETQGLSFGRDRFVKVATGARGRLPVDGRLENGILDGNANFFWKADTAFPLTWVGHAELAVGQNLDGENQFVLGGENGARGYHVRAFTGSQAAMANMEARFYYPEEILALAYIGGAVFFDVAAATPEGRPLSGVGWYPDVGVGLRFGPTRSASGLIGRVDVAYALREGPGGGSRYVVSIATGHAFDTFTNAAHKVLVGPQTEIREESLVTRIQR